jgi:hypothetical protein
MLYNDAALLFILALFGGLVLLARAWAITNIARHRR